MKAVLETWWDVSLDSYARDNGIEPASVPRELSWYISASINDIAALDTAEGWARDHGRPGRLRIAGNRAHVGLAWCLDVDRTAWLAIRGLGRRAGARRDLLDHMTHELYHLPSLCTTDVVMRVRFRAAGQLITRTLRPQDRHRSASRWPHP
ncbi:hypothetical protein AB0N09_35760 [Streptomyces erythrochromogenes]|uniref:hypothetical protein n=1 Tax=Streptomyces erythrochromogenes TaxID=285574 RepID=UPI00341A01C4